MIIISDQIALSNILPLDPRESNVIFQNGFVKIETQEEYLNRVPLLNRYLGLDVIMLLPAGEYTSNAFLNLINTGHFIFNIYRFANNLEDLQIVRGNDAVINNLESDSATDALSAAMGKELKRLLDEHKNDHNVHYLQEEIVITAAQVNDLENFILENEVDPIFTSSPAAQITDEEILNWDLHIISTSNPHNVTKEQVGLGNVSNVDTTNPSNITQDSTHRFVSDSEKSTWNGKQDTLGFTPENTSNKISTFQATPDNIHYPTEKLVKDSLDGKQPIGTYSTDIHSNITALNAVSGVNTGDNATNSTSNAYADSKIEDTIINGVTTKAPSQNAVYDALSLKQDTLQSGVNIKTINNESLVGSGNITITGSGGDVSGPASSVDNDIALFNGTTGKIIKDSGKTIVTTLGSTDTTVPTSKAVKDVTDTKVTANGAITGATKTKITYDSKGLVTSGADATTADIADSLNKRYITDSQLTVIENTSGTNTGDETQSSIITKIGYTPENVANKVTSISSSSTDTQYPSAKLVYDQLATKQPTITLTTLGSSGASTFISNTLNIPTYTLIGLGGEPIITTGSSDQYWRGDKSWQTLNTSVVIEGSRLYYTDTRARSAISLTTNNSSGAATYSNSTGTFNIPNYTLSGLGGQPLNSILTSISGLSTVTTGLIKLTNGTASLDTSTYLTANQTITLGGILSGSGKTSITVAAASGYYMPTTTDQSNWNGKQSALNGTGFIKISGTTISYDNSTYLLSSSYTASDVLSKLLTVDGTGTGLDADLLDGQHGSYYTDIVGRLGFTPYNATNPSGYTSNTGTVTSVIAGTGLSGGTITTSGTISVNYGTTSSTACAGDDSRLSNVRTAAPNLGSNLALNSYNLDFTASLGSNQTYSGKIETGTVGESVVFGDVLYLKFSDGKWWKAKADSYSTTPGARMSLATISANASGVLLIEGNVRYDSWTLAANKVYLSSSTAGALTTTQPSTTGNQIQVLGIAKTSTTMYFRPSYDIGEK